MTTGEVRDGEEGLPDIGGAVVEGSGDVGAGGSDLLGVIEDEAGTLAAQRLAVEVPDAFAFLGGQFALHADENAAVGQGFGQVADGGDDFGAPTGEADEPGATRQKQGRAGRVGWSAP